MINRIRDIRRQKGLTLADLAAACVPPTTPQTVGRLETGMRNLSLKWMERIAAALEVDPEMLVRSEAAEQPQIVARLAREGAEAPPETVVYAWYDPVTGEGSGARCEGAIQLPFAVGSAPEPGDCGGAGGRALDRVRGWLGLD